MRTPTAFLLLATLTVAAAAPAAAEIFRWVDSSGTPHFSDRAEDVPPEYRDQLENGGAPAPEGRSRFVVVPGLNPELPEDGTAVRPIDEAAFEAEAMAALGGMGKGQGGSGGGLPDFGSLLKAGAPVVAGVIVGVLVAIVIGLAIAVVILRVSCRICGEEPPAFGKGMGIVLLQTLAVSALGVLVGLLVMGSGVAGGLEVQGAQFGAGVLIQAGVLRGMLIESYGKSLAVTAVAIGIQLAIGFALGLGIFALVAALG